MTAPSGEVQTNAGGLFAEAAAIMARLRGPDGCPWDREQSFASIRKHTLEETYEVLDAIERRDWPNLQEELGDLLLQVLFYAQMAEDGGYFTLAAVITGLNLKLVRRHPHVFGEAASIAAGNAAREGMETSGIDAGQVLRNWEQIKRAEKPGGSMGTESRLDGVARNLPALMEASKLGSNAAKCGFDWPDLEGVFAKLEEEIGELREAIDQRGDREEAAKKFVNHENADSESAADRIGAETGDLLFTVVNLARHLGVEAELALRGTNQRFRGRFAEMERLTAIPLEQQSPEQLEFLWSEAKRAEAGVAPDGVK